MYVYIVDFNHNLNYLTIFQWDNTSDAKLAIAWITTIFELSLLVDLTTHL